MLQALNNIPKQYKSNLSFHASVVSITDECCEVYIHSGTVRLEIRLKVIDLERVGEMVTNSPKFAVWEVIGIKTVRKTIKDVSKDIDCAGLKLCILSLILTESGSTVELILNGPNLLKSVINHSSMFGSVSSPPREIACIVAEVSIFKPLNETWTYTMQVGPLFMHGIVDSCYGIVKFGALCDFKASMKQ